MQPSSTKIENVLGKATYVLLLWHYFMLRMNHKTTHHFLSFCIWPSFDGQNSHLHFSLTRRGGRTLDHRSGTVSVKPNKNSPQKCKINTAVTCMYTERSSRMLFMLKDPYSSFHISQTLIDTHIWSHNIGHIAPSGVSEYRQFQTQYSLKQDTIDGIQ